MILSKVPPLLSESHNLLEDDHIFELKNYYKGLKQHYKGYYNDVHKNNNKLINEDITNRLREISSETINIKDIERLDT